MGSKLLAAVVLSLCAVLAGFPAIGGYYNSQGQWCEGANNSLCEGASTSSGSNVPTSTYDPDMAAAGAFGQLLGVLLNAVIEESAKERPAKKKETKGNKQNPAFCTNSLCYPKGDPARYPAGSRAQFEAVCAMSNAENNTSYLNYSTISACADAMASIAAIDTTRAFSAFVGSELPSPDSMFTVPEIPDDGAYSSTALATEPTAEEDNDRGDGGGQCKPIDEQGRDCLNQIAYNSDIDDYGNTTYKITLQNSCNVEIFGQVSYANNPSKPSQGMYFAPGASDSFTCNDWANGGTCGGFGQIFQKCSR